MQVFIFVFYLCFFSPIKTEEHDFYKNNNEELHLPKGFLIGASTASYQIEGAWNVSGKGESIWDRHVHDHPDWVADQANGDIAADSYHSYEDDIKIAKKLNLKMYRFSISWPRVLPTGDISQINEEGIAYYNNLIDRLLEEKIEPMVTMFHWDLPQYLQDSIGGWANPLLADYFEDYAHLLYLRFGKKVKYWITINEAGEICKGYAYEHFYPPNIHSPGIGEYRCAHTILLCHARAYRLYENNFRKLYNGQISITISSRWFQPKTSSKSDLEAANIRFEFDYGWFAHPIFSKLGNYPQIMRDRIGNNSLKEGRFRSRLPNFTAAEINLIHGSADYIALNYYTARLVTFGEEGLKPSKDRDSGTIISIDPSWPSSFAPWLKSVPWSFGKLLEKINTIYPKWNIIVTENGYADQGELIDIDRCHYIISYMRSMLLTMKYKNVPVIGYIHWSLIDNFEWMDGYRFKFGLFSIDYLNPSRPRIIKESAKLYANISLTGIVPNLSYLDKLKK